MLLERKQGEAAKARPHQTPTIQPPNETCRRISETQMARRLQRDKPFGNEVGRSYMEELKQKKQQLIRERAAQQSQAWQQQPPPPPQASPQQGDGAGHYPQY